MAVPKKRTGKAKQASRRANWKGSVPETTICKNCGAVVLTHTVCTECGQYKGAVASKKVTKAATKE
jgi:large subunit ribosomal protein L32